MSHRRIAARGSPESARRCEEYGVIVGTVFVAPSWRLKTHKKTVPHVMSSNTAPALNACLFGTKKVALPEVTEACFKPLEEALTCDLR
jgi:hypothetical protein